MADTDKKVLALICSQLGVSEEQAVPTATLDADLGMDSLDSVEILIDLEQEFVVEILDDDAEKWKTIQDVYDYIASAKTKS